MSSEKRYTLHILVYRYMLGLGWECVGNYDSLDDIEFLIFNTEARIESYSVFDNKTGDYII